MPRAEILPEFDAAAVALIEQHLRLAYKIAWTYYRQFGGAIREAPESAAHKALFKAVRYYRPARGKFKALLRVCVRRQVSLAVRSAERLPGSLDSGDDGAADVPDHRSLRTGRAADLPGMEEMLCWVTPRQAECLRLQYGEGLGRDEIAARMGITKSRVHMLRNAAVIRLRREYMDRFGAAPRAAAR